MYDGIAKLIGYNYDTTPTYDSAGNETYQEVETTVFVQPRGVYQSEFYNASQVGLQPNLTLYIANKADYAGQKMLEYEGKRYSVIRVDWKAQRDGISLICEERINNG